MLCAQGRCDKQMLLDAICNVLALLHEEHLLSNMLMHALASDAAAALGTLVRASSDDSRQQACVCHIGPCTNAHSWHRGVHRRDVT